MTGGSPGGLQAPTGIFARLQELIKLGELVASSQVISPRMTRASFISGR
jgi:hypothetical protein